ncbi:MAG: hypothetical protein LBH58_11970 [Tannerellaceae bacterium]|jgi:hypothetical protein|nr:hypothetical protein [Tannerellaceae bacterium]
MKEKQLPLVTFEQAKRLKEFGFDYNAEFCFDEGGDGKARLGLKKMPYIKIRHKYTLCPTVALALKWIRDEKNMHEIVTAHTVCFSTESYYMANRKEFDDYEAAESALLDELLTILEKRND